MGEELTAQEAVYAGYDAIQLLPVVPTIEYRREDTVGDYEFFAVLADTDAPDELSASFTDHRPPDLSHLKSPRPFSENLIPKIGATMSPF